MRHIITKSFLAIFLLATVACKKNDDVIRNNDFLIDVKQNLPIPVTVTSKEEIVFDLTITSKSDNVIKTAVLSLNETDLTTASVNSNEITLQHTYNVTGQNVGNSLIFRLTVTDENDKVIDKDFVVYIQSAPAEITINIPSSAPAEIKDNELADFNIDVVSENDIRYIKTFVDQTEITSLTKEVFADAKTDTYNFVYSPTIADADKTLSFTIEVMDVLGNIIQKTYSLNIIRSQAVDFTTYNDVLIGAQNSTTGPFFNASNGEVYNKTGAATKAAGIDLVTFYSGSTYAFNIVSPTLTSVAQYIYTVTAYGADAIDNWAVKNQTFIKKITLTRAEFDLIANSAAIEALYTGSAVTASETSGGVTTNSTIVFKTAANKYGVLFIKDKSANSSSGTLTTDIKIQN